MFHNNYATKKPSFNSVDGVIIDNKVQLSEVAIKSISEAPIEDSGDHSLNKDAILEEVGVLEREVYEKIMDTTLNDVSALNNGMALK